MDSLPRQLPTALPEPRDNWPAAMVALCGWLMPGMGYWLLGRRVRAVIIALCVIAIFVMGVLIGGIRVVDAPTNMGPSALLAKPWFIGQVLTGPISVAAAMWANHVDDSHVSHSRSWELGTLYTAIAGMLNLLVVIDAAYRAATEPAGEAPPAGT